MINLNFKLHQPTILKRYTVFDIGNSSEYFENMQLEDETLLSSAQKLLELAEEGGVEFGLTITGSTLESLEKSSPEVIDIIKKMLETGNVELMASTFSDTIARKYSKDEFEAQVRSHSEMVKSIFDVVPKTIVHDSPVDGLKVLHQKTADPDEKVKGVHTMDFKVPVKNSQMFNNMITSLTKEHDFIVPSDLIEAHEFANKPMNKLQSSAVEQLFQLKDKIYLANDESIIQRWRLLQDTNHIENMCTEYVEGNPYENPYDAYIAYMNIVNDMSIRIKKEG